MKESAGQKKSIDYLHSLGAWTVKIISANKSGVHDIIACVPMTKEQILKMDQEVIGVFVSLEQKKEEGGVTSPLQDRNMKQIKKAGGLTAIILTVRDIKKLPF